MNQTLNAIIFDLDDTLYAERDFVLSGFRSVAEWAVSALGIPIETGYTTFVHLFETGVRGDTFNRWLAEFDIPANDACIRQMVKIYRQHTPQIHPFPETTFVLQSLQKKFQLGLVSDGYLEVQQRKLESLGLKHFFDAVVFSDEWGRAAWKPSQQPFLAVCERLMVKPETAVYIADNPTKDFLGARQIGMFTIWVCRPEGEYTHLTPPTPAHSPHKTISELVTLPQALNSVAP